MIATAESCTGGMLACLLTDIPGSSAVFERGFVTYSNQAKSDMLGVAAELIEHNGAVSEPVATAMAKGAISNSCADVGVSITGIAGPGGGSEEKPVGCVYIAIADREGWSKCVRYLFVGDRSTIRAQACDAALSQVNDLIGLNCA